MLAEEAKQPIAWWYLSFAGPKFLGAAIVSARGVTHAIREAHRLGINPGGEVMAFQIPEPGPLPPNRLLQRAEIERLTGESMERVM